MRIPLGALGRGRRFVVTSSGREGIVLDLAFRGNVECDFGGDRRGRARVGGGGVAMIVAALVFVMLGCACDGWHAACLYLAAAAFAALGMPWRRIA